MSNNEPDSAGDFASLLTVLGILVIATGFLAWTVYDEWKHM
ncbi:hypothetical protein [Nocardia farcinica]|nr:hypothetical protein [Nocardia farcinica]